MNKNRKFLSITLSGSIISGVFAFVFEEFIQLIALTIFGAFVALFIGGVIEAIISIKYKNISSIAINLLLSLTGGRRHTLAGSYGKIEFTQNILLQMVILRHLTEQPERRHERPVGGISRCSQTVSGIFHLMCIIEDCLFQPTIHRDFCEYSINLTRGMTSNRMLESMLIYLNCRRMVLIFRRVYT